MKFVPMFFTRTPADTREPIVGVNLLISNTEELDPVFLGLSLFQRCGNFTRMHSKLRESWTCWETRRQ